MSERSVARTGVFPGSFNPPTVAHLAIADAARRVHALDTVELVLSVDPLGKSTVGQPTVAQRVDVLRIVARQFSWLSVRTTDQQLIADIATGYDLVVMGADKWHQIHDVAFYDGSIDARDASLGRLPQIAVVPRAGLDVPDDLVLPIDPEFHEVSSTLARSGRHDLVIPEALGLLTAQPNDPVDPGSQASG